MAKQPAPVEGVYERVVGTGKWYGRYYLNDSQVRKSFGRDWVAAVAWVEAARTVKRSGRVSGTECSSRWKTGCNTKRAQAVYATSVQPSFSLRDGSSHGRLDLPTFTICVNLRADVVVNVV
jgi:hypothetical protein